MRKKKLMQRNLQVMLSVKLLFTEHVLQRRPLCNGWLTIQYWSEVYIGTILGKFKLTLQVLPSVTWSITIVCICPSGDCLSQVQQCLHDPVLQYMFTITIYTWTCPWELVNPYMVYDFKWIECMQNTCTCISTWIWKNKKGTWTDNGTKWRL